jgi:predicted amidophosphoribosyltransferase
MKITHDPKTNETGNIEPAHTVEILCSSCGYDIDEAELVADTCADCGAPLNLKQHVSIQVTTLPIFGSSM